MKLLRIPDDHYDTIIETLQLDAKSSAFDTTLRREISDALDSIVEVKPKPAPDVMVVMEGGVVQNIITTGKLGTVRVLDYDCQEEADGTSIFNIPQDEGKDEEAYVSRFKPERAGKWYRKVLKSIETQSKEANHETPVQS